MSGPPAVAKRFADAANRHDPEALVACMSPDFDSVQPVHPGRAFGGIFILGVADDQVQWARVYTEPVEQSGAGIDASINAAYDRGPASGSASISSSASP